MPQGHVYTKGWHVIHVPALLVIPLGFEPKTHALEGRCSNPTELRNHLRVQKYNKKSLWQKVYGHFSRWPRCSLTMASLWIDTDDRKATEFYTIPLSAIHNARAIVPDD